jgi:hypothetical protein
MKRHSDPGRGSIVFGLLGNFFQVPAKIVGEISEASTWKGPSAGGTAPEFQKLLPDPAERIMKFEFSPSMAVDNDSSPLLP